MNKVYNIKIEPTFNPDILEENVEYNFDVIVEEKNCIETVATGYFSFSGIDLSYVLIHCDLDYMEQSYEYVENYMSEIIESINE